MHPSRLRLKLVVFALLCAACEVRVGTGSDWDGSIWDDPRWNDDGFGDDPKTDAGRSDAALAQDDDAGAGPEDAAVSGDAAVLLDAALPVEDASTDAGSGGGSTVSVIDVAKALARGSCAALEDCMGETLLLDSLDGKDCVDYRTNVYLDRDLHWLGKSIARSRVTFRPNLLAECESDLRASRCEVQADRLPTSCRDALDGKAGLDDSCGIDQECGGALFCDKGQQETCPGTCRALVRGGLPCTASTQCESGTLCRAGSCTAPLAEGDSCTVRLGYGECPPGLVCQGARDAYTCQAIDAIYAAQVGDECDAFGKLCGFGLVCQSQSGTKGKCMLTADEGDRCRPSIPSQCPIAQYCKDQRAGVTTRAPAGQDGVCSDLPADGMGCESSVGCKAGAICLSDDTICHDFKSVGQACISNRECYGGSCRDGTCAAPLDCSL